MKYITIDNLTKDMICANPIYDKNNVLLIRGNKKLDERHIKRLKNNKLKGIYIYDNKLIESYKNIKSEEDRIKMLNKSELLNLDAVLYLSNEIVNNMQSINEIQIELDSLSNFDKITYIHSVNVALTSVVIGIALGYNNVQLNELCIAALLHDIGKLVVGENIICKSGLLDKNERNIIEQHTIYGKMMLDAFPQINYKIKDAILEHHENEDGTGYPFGKKGYEINEYAKIIHVADVYDAVLSKRPYKNECSYTESLEYILGNSGKMFNSEIVNILINYIIPYPIGTKIILSNGQAAIVLNYNRHLPLRPKIILGNEIIDLSKEKFNVTITEVLK